MKDTVITGNAKILVVDDDPINIRNAVRILKDDYKVTYATGGRSALELVAKDRPALILLDLHMPEMNGFEVLEVLRSNEDTKDIPVIFLTADSDRETEAKGLQAGASDFIAKPFMDEIVKQRVGHLLELSILQKGLENEVLRQTAELTARQNQLEEMSFQTVQALAGAIDAKDPYTKGHSARVSEYAVLLAAKAGWSKDEQNKLKYAALLHDVGKIGVPDMVLNKPGRLTDVEFGVIRSHTTVGSDILRNISAVADAVEVARHHHERYDGKGYPDGLAGEDIPIMARIACVADSYDAMNSKRVYRNALPRDVIREELAKGKGTQFDPELLDLFLEMFDNGELVIREEKPDKRLNDGAAIIKSVFENAYDSGSNNQIDALTGLPLRKNGEDRIRNMMAENEGCLILADLDNLKKLNDLFGHMHGDELISRLGRILNNAAGIETACRLGGDEFLLFTKEHTMDGVSAVLDSILGEFDEVKGSDEHFTYNSISCGACLTDNTMTFEDAYSNADKALYYVKRNGKGSFHIYESDIPEQTVESNVDLEAILKAFEVSGEYEGAMQVDYREFTQLFEYVKNMQRRYSYEIQLVMVTLEAAESGSPNIDRIGHAVTAMEEAIRNTIRTVDVCTRYSNLQFLVILFGAGRNETPAIMDRIFSGYYKTADDRMITPSYTIAQL